MASGQRSTEAFGNPPRVFDGLCSPPEAVPFKIGFVRFGINVMTSRMSFRGFKAGSDHMWMSFAGLAPKEYPCNGD
jgi:hypothetical protein